MPKPLLSKKKAISISNGAALVGLGMLIYSNKWWPGVLLVFWVALVLRQSLTGRYYDAILSTIILVGLFLVAYIKINWSVLIPVLFVIGGIYLIFREFFYADDSLEDEILNENSEDENDFKS